MALDTKLKVGQSFKSHNFFPCYPYKMLCSFLRYIPLNNLLIARDVQCSVGSRDSQGFSSENVKGNMLF